MHSRLASGMQLSKSTRNMGKGFPADSRGEEFVKPRRKHSMPRTDDHPACEAKHNHVTVTFHRRTPRIAARSALVGHRRTRLLARVLDRVIAPSKNNIFKS
jgi:hypothetical protein